MELKKGDVVILKSGGPKMTICEYPQKTLDGRENASLAKCEWFDSELHKHSAVFHIDELQKI